MRIAYFTSNRTTIPPDPSQIAASITVTTNIIKELSKRHKITLYAAKGSHMDGVDVEDLNLEPFLVDSALADNDWITKAVLVMKQIYIGEIFKRASEYDIIHLQTEPIYMAMPYVRLIKTPVLFTCHNAYHQFEQSIFNYYDNKVYISMLSQNQAKAYPLKQSTPVVYNGVETNKYPFYEKSKDYFLFLGRLTNEKGIYDYLRLAELNKNDLFYVAGKGVATKEVEDFSKTHENVKIIGMVRRESKQWYDLYGNARALIFPIQWEEPFGLTLIESMACGTPVIAYNRGAVAEIIKDGETGFIVKKNEIESLQESIEKLTSLSDTEYAQIRKQSRIHVEQHFTASRMANEYEKLYTSIIEDFKSSDI